MILSKKYYISGFCDQSSYKLKSMFNIGKFKNNLYSKIRSSLYLNKIEEKTTASNQLYIENYLHKYLYNNPKYQGADKLTRFEFQAFSQFGEDGIIEEIFRRIGKTNCFFVEFGVEDGRETNTTYLLYQGWKGLWIDGDENNIKNINSFFSQSISSGHLLAIRSFITAENIEQLFQQGNVPTELDLLSIDIDRNDYYVWDAINSYNPRVVIIEYNSIFRPGCKFVVKYNANAIWDRTSNYGASLDALQELGEKKGYKLVASSFAGVNAFFVRNDLIEGNFEGPFTAANHHEPPRYFLYKKDGHPRNIDL